MVHPNCTRGLPWVEIVGVSLSICSLPQVERGRNVSTSERDIIVGGQAVIEGVMMRTPNAYAIAVRKADGTIVNTAARMPKWSDKYPILKLPILRGSAVLVQSMGLGIKSLNYSANEAFGDAQEAEASEAREFRVALTPAAIEGEGDFAGLTGAVPGLFPVPTQKRSRDEMKEGGTAAAAALDECPLHRRGLGTLTQRVGRFRACCTRNLAKLGNVDHQCCGK